MGKVCALSVQSSRGASPKVVAIIVNHNTRELLVQCLDSLRITEIPGGLQIVVVDNGSSDGSFESVRENFPSVLLLRNEENMGFAKANNQAILATRSEYVCLINSDVVVLANCIQRLVEFLDGNPDVAVVGPKLVNGDGSHQVSCKRFPSAWRVACTAIGLHFVLRDIGVFAGTEVTWLNPEEVADVDALAGAFMLIRRSAIEEVGLLDETFFFYGEDIDWCKRFHVAGWRVVYLPKAVAKHFGGASSKKDKRRFSVQLERAKRQYWRKHHSFIGYYVFAGLSIATHVTRIVGCSVCWLVCPARRDSFANKIMCHTHCLRNWVSKRS